MPKNFVLNRYAILSVIVACGTVFIAFCVCQWLPGNSAAIALGSGTAAANTAADVTRLDNGIRLVLRPIKGIGRIAIESIYDVGFVDEPKGMCQASHLLEHLVCFAPTESYRQGESFEQLNQSGMANAETLPDWTHYDYILPADQLELALKIETERLTSLRIDQETVAREIPRVYQETDAVEKYPQAGLLKHAFMVFSQAWRHGEKTALVRGGLAGIPLERLSDFHAATYRPDRLTLIIAGDFDTDQARQAVLKTVGTVAPSTRESRQPIDWEKLPASMTVEWDTSLNAVCVYYPPPLTALDRIVLSHVGTQWTNSLTNDSKLKKTTDMVMPSSFQWSVGELPFFVYAAAKTGVSLEPIERDLKDSLQKFLNTPPEQMIKQIRVNSTMIANQLRLGSGRDFDSMVDMVSKQQKMDRKRALDLVVGQSALSERTLRNLGGDAADGGADQLQKLQPEQLKTIIDNAFKPANQRLIRLVPQKSKP